MFSFPSDRPLLSSRYCPRAIPKDRVVIRVFSLSKTSRTVQNIRRCILSFDPFVDKFFYYFEREVLKKYPDIPLSFLSLKCLNASNL